MHTAVNMYFSTL